MTEHDSNNQSINETSQKRDTTTKPNRTTEEEINNVRTFIENKIEDGEFNVYVNENRTRYNNDELLKLQESIAQHLRITYPQKYDENTSNDECISIRTLKTRIKEAENTRASKITNDNEDDFYNLLKQLIKVHLHKTKTYFDTRETINPLNKTTKVINYYTIVLIFRDYERVSIVQSISALLSEFFDAQIDYIESNVDNLVIHSRTIKSFYKLLSFIDENKYGSLAGATTPITEYEEVQEKTLTAE